MVLVSSGKKQAVPWNIFGLLVFLCSDYSYD